MILWALIVWVIEKYFKNEIKIWPKRRGHNNFFLYYQYFGNCMPRKWLLISFKPVNKKTVTVSQFWLEEESENEILIQPINWWVFHHINVTSNIYQFIMNQNRIKDELLQTSTSVLAHISTIRTFLGSVSVL